MEQMDVDEFWSRFMDKLENELRPFKRDLIIRRSFGGLLSNELICRDCPHQSSREELFLALPLQVKNKRSIYEGLQTMTEGEMLEGDNAYFCEKCEKKVSTLMRMCIKRLPNVLLCVLKRFEFNLETLTK
jgi:ubiquitin carboxyl-terminal hydrolase 9/24